MKEQEILAKYRLGITSVREVARLSGVSNHRVKRVLLKHGVLPIKSKAKPFSETHRRNISKACKGRKGWCKGLRMSRLTRLKNLLGHSRFEVSLEWAERFHLDALMCFNMMLTPRSGRWAWTTEQYVAFVERFHDDQQFLSVFRKWVEGGKKKYQKPSIDHIIPKSRGGDDSLENLQILSWFENRAKNDLTAAEWQQIKNNLTDYLT